MTAILDKHLLACDVPTADVVGAHTVISTSRGRQRYVNLDYAASAPALASVVENIAAALPEYASVHRGAGQLSQLTTARYEDARHTVAGFVHARADDHVIFTRNTTDAINLLAHCVPGDTVVLDIEHHANLLPWRRRGVRVVDCRESLDATVHALDAELAARPAALLAVTGASNVTGEIVPVVQLATIAHRHGARILVDAAQLAPHRSVDLSGNDIDYAVFSGHKLYAPFGAGVMVGRADWLDSAPPYLAGGGATVDVAAGGSEVSWHTGPARHEAGSPNVLGALSIAAAINAIGEIGYERINITESELRARLDGGLSAIRRVHPLRIWREDAERVGICAFSVEGYEPRDVAEYLSANHGIGVRDGRFCAHPTLSRLGYPSGAVRASFGLGTRSSDIDRLIHALSELTGDNR